MLTVAHLLLRWELRKARKSKSLRRKLKVEEFPITKRKTFHRFNLLNRLSNCGIDRSLREQLVYPISVQKTKPKSENLLRSLPLKASKSKNGLRNTKRRKAKWKRGLRNWKISLSFMRVKGNRWRINSVSLYKWCNISRKNNKELRKKKPKEKKILRD